jgi:hypothetical protein
MVSYIQVVCHKFHKQLVTPFDVLLNYHKSLPRVIQKLYASYNPTLGEGVIKKESNNLLSRTVWKYVPRKEEVTKQRGSQLLQNGYLKRN